MSHLHLVGLAALTLSLARGSESGTRRVVTPPVLQLTPSPVVGGNPVTGTVTLASAAPATGTTLTISTSSITLAPLVNPRLGASSAVTSLTLVVPQGQTVATFRINTPGVPTSATATISATASGEVTSASLTILPASVVSVVIAPASVIGGQPATATVSLDGKAPSPGGVPVTLSAAITSLQLLGSTSSAATVSVPPSVAVNAGASSATFAVTTTAVSAAASASVTASLGRSASASLDISAPTPIAVQFNPGKLLGGTPAIGTVVLNAPTPAEGIRVGLTSSSANVTVPSSITVPGGADRQTFTASTTPVASSVKASVTATSAREATTRTGGTTVTMSDGSVRTIQGVAASGFLVLDPPPSPASILLSKPLIIGGTSSTGTVVLTGLAPASGIVVGLTASTADATVPASITVPAGLDRQTFQITTRPVVSNSQVTIATQRPASTTTSTASISDGTSNTIQFPESRAATAVLGVLEQPRVQSVVVQPSAVTGGSPVSIAVNFSTSTTSISPDALATYAAAITLSTNHPELLALPNSLSAGSSGSTSSTTLTTGGFIASATAATTVPSADQSVSLTATLVTSSGSTSLLVRAPVPPIATFSVRPTTATAGTNVLASLALSTAITTSQTVQLTADPSGIVIVPASVLVAPGRALALTFSTVKVPAQTTVTITAIAGSQRVPVSVVIVP